MTNEEAGTKTVLVVDDDPMNLRIAEFVLKKELNVNVLKAESGVKCIEYLQQKAAIDVILLDIQMPRMDGLKTLELIRRRDDWKQIPVFFLTATADKETVVKASQLGISGYIKKPFLPQDLVDRVAEVFLQQTVEDPDIAKLLNKLGK